MKSISSILLTALCALAMSVKGQTVLFEKMHGTYQRGNMAFDIIETHDENFLLAGISASNSFWGIDGKIMKVNQNGDTLWTRIFYVSLLNNSNDYLFSVVRKGNNYLFAGNGYLNPSKNQEAWLLELDLSGNKINEKKFGGTNDEEISKIMALPNTGFIAVGSTSSFGTQDGKSDVWLIRLNNNLDTLWTKTYNLGAIDKGVSIMPFQNDKYIIIANSCINNCTNALYYQTTASTIIIDTLGNLITTKTYNAGSKNQFNAIAPTHDGGAIITGVTNTTLTHPNVSLWVLKLDVNADTTWTKKYGNPYRYNVGSSAFQQQDGNYIVAGSTQSYVDQITTDFDCPWVLKLNQQGDSLWSVVRGGLENDGIKKIIPANDGSIVFAGYYDLPSDTGSIIVPAKFYIGKIADTLLSSIAETNASPSVQIFPNPFQTFATIKVNFDLSNSTLTIYNSLGQIVKLIKNISGQTVTMHRDNLPSGLYFIQLTDKNKVLITSKFIITD